MGDVFKTAGSNLGGELCYCFGVGAHAIRIVLAVGLSACTASTTRDGDAATDASVERDASGARDASSDSRIRWDTGPDADASSDDAGLPHDVPGLDAWAVCSSEMGRHRRAVGEAGGGTCSFVIRLDHDTLRLRSHALVCGEPAIVDEASARANAMAQTEYGGGVALNPPDPLDAWVFYDAPADFGGVAVVNARNGESVFGGSIVWDGAGDITYPEWEYVYGWCHTYADDIAVRGYDLIDGSELEAAEVDAVMNVVRLTAIPHALGDVGSDLYELLDAVVLRYPRTVGAFDSSTAEWIAIINGGRRE